MGTEYDDLFNDDISSEGGDDYKLTPADFKETFIIPSDWTVSTPRQEMNDIVDLSPSFQRRSVWTKKAKSKFIESLILGIPIPQILFAEDKNYRNNFLILDGKQRLTAIKEFFEERFDDGSKFQIQGLDDLSEINGETWSTLRQNFPEYARSIEAAPIRTAIIRGWKKDDILYEIFFRLNSGSVKLSPMELRMSLIRGPYLREVIKKTSQIRSIQQLLGLKSADKRMKDVEVAIRHMAFCDNRVSYRGNLKNFLDDYCRIQNDTYDSDRVEQELRALDDVIKFGMEVFGSGRFGRKFVSRYRKYERSFNRAVFDVLAWSFSSSSMRHFASEDHQRYREIFERVCEDQLFIKYVESTTKSIEATYGRFSIWGSALRQASQIELELPKF